MILLLGGNKQNGKDELAKNIQEMIPCVILEMSEKLKEMSEDALGIDRGAMQKVKDTGWTITYDDDGREIGRVRPRNVMQKTGTGARKNLGNHIWATERLRIARKTLQTLSRSKFPLVIITGIRDNSEAMYFKDNHKNVIMIKIERPDLKRTDNDATETSVDQIEYDMLVVNKTLKGLKWSAAEIYNKYLI